MTQTKRRYTIDETRLRVAVEILSETDIDNDEFWTAFDTLKKLRDQMKEMATEN